MGKLQGGTGDYVAVSSRFYFDFLWHEQSLSFSSPPLFFVENGVFSKCRNDL